VLVKVVTEMLFWQCTFGEPWNNYLGSRSQTSALENRAGTWINTYAHTSSLYFETWQYGLTYRIRGNCWYIIIIYLGKQAQHEHAANFCVGIVIVPLCVSDITASIHPNKAKQGLEWIPFEKNPKNAQYRHLLKAPDLNSGTERSEVIGCVSGQDVVGS